MIEKNDRGSKLLLLLEKNKVGPLNDSLRGTRGKELHCYYWKPRHGKEPKGIIMLCHGFGEYLSWYEELASMLAENGYFVYGHDHVGHGKSEGIKGKVNSIAELVDDIFLHAEYVKKLYPKQPSFLIGHSMGGMISVVCATRKEIEEFDGMILLAPLINSNAANNTALTRSLARLLNHIAPDLVVGSLDVDLITHCEMKKLQIKSDPLQFKGGLRACTAVAFMSGMEEISRSNADIDIPFLLIHGEKDMLCCPEASRQFFEKASSSDKTFHLIPEMLHNPCQELPVYKDQVFQEVMSWINERTTHSIEGNPEN